jgi:hypothetical protein
MLTKANISEASNLTKLTPKKGEIIANVAAFCPQLANHVT